MITVPVCEDAALHNDNITINVFYAVLKYRASLDQQYHIVRKYM